MQNPKLSQLGFDIVNNIFHFPNWFTCVRQQEHLADGEELHIQCLVQGDMAKTHWDYNTLIGSELDKSAKEARLVTLDLTVRVKISIKLCLDNIHQLGKSNTSESNTLAEEDDAGQDS
ncbi:hypothetical protein CFO_g5278 [Ceratocystis platani]|uniref:Uncharacterized protein n=1 Tax=Ceratocystis fimbriata f. sp. platani TaxID=88771 RepID=A0A0F8BJC5_CERFI|nr:hypothetical protein CFO_g5278 [Ceratocystis platani]